MPRGGSGSWPTTAAESLAGSTSWTSSTGRPAPRARDRLAPEYVQLPGGRTRPPDIGPDRSRRRRGELQPIRRGEHCRVRSGARVATDDVRRPPTLTAIESERGAGSAPSPSGGSPRTPRWPRPWSAIRRRRPVARPFAIGAGRIVYPGLQRADRPYRAVWLFELKKPLGPTSTRPEAAEQDHVGAPGQEARPHVKSEPAAPRKQPRFNGRDRPGDRNLRTHDMLAALPAVANNTTTTAINTTAADNALPRSVTMRRRRLEAPPPDREVIPGTVGTAAPVRRRRARHSGGAHGSTGPPAPTDPASRTTIRLRPKPPQPLISPPRAEFSRTV